MTPKPGQGEQEGPKGGVADGLSNRQRRRDVTAAWTRPRVRSETVASEVGYGV
jgi:hypothetical protein